MTGVQTCALPISVGSYLPGVNRLPIFKDLAAARQALYEKYIGQQQTINALKTPPTPPAGGAPAAEADTFLQRMGARFGGMRQAVEPVLRGAGSVPGAIGRSAVAAAPFAAVAAPPAAMMYHDYRNFQQQTPEQQRESAMNALSGTAPGQAY